MAAIRLATARASRLSRLALGLGLALDVGSIDALHQPIEAPHQLGPLGQHRPGATSAPLHHGLAESLDGWVVGQITASIAHGLADEGAGHQLSQLFAGVLRPACA